MSNKVAVIIEHDEHGYYAYCPGLENCQTEGESFDVVMENITEAIRLYMETMTEEEIEASCLAANLDSSLELEIDEWQAFEDFEEG